MRSHVMDQLRAALFPYRAQENGMRARWERDEAERYRKLPARAWPAYQPDADQVPSLRALVENCGGESEEKCASAKFKLATALLFNNIDTKEGIKRYRSLASRRDVSGMTATGIVLLESFGVDSILPEEREGIAWLLRASASRGKDSSQAMYELGTALYTGIENVLAEDERIAFSYFRRAAGRGHHAAQFMAADMLLQGTGTTQDVAQAIPLLCKSAESGHRFARQRMRELFDMTKE